MKDLLGREFCSLLIYLMESSRKHRPYFMKQRKCPFHQVQYSAWMDEGKGERERERENSKMVAYCSLTLFCTRVWYIVLFCSFLILPIILLPCCCYISIIHRKFLQFPSLMRAMQHASSSVAGRTPKRKKAPKDLFPVPPLRMAEERRRVLSRACLLRCQQRGIVAVVIYSWG